MATAWALPAPVEGDFTAPHTYAADGATAALRLHYRTIGQPRFDGPGGRCSNVVLVMHGTTGSGQQFFNPSAPGAIGSLAAFTLPLFGPGAPLDAAEHYVVFPDAIGHGGSSKPSDGLRMRFPAYTYADMVASTHQLLTAHLGVDHIKLVTGTSMGGMLSWAWGVAHPGFMDALFPLASTPFELAGQNRYWRQLAIDAIVGDPGFAGGEYEEGSSWASWPGMRTACGIQGLMGAAPLLWQQSFPTRGTAEAHLAAGVENMLAGGVEPCDLIFAYNASREYNPFPELGKVEAPLFAVNTEDDRINPPELGLVQRGVAALRPWGKAHVVPASLATRGHGSHTVAALWLDCLAELLAVAAAPGGGRAPEQKL
jgi:homoserine O-acetyltransferase